MGGQMAGVPVVLVADEGMVLHAMTLLAYLSFTHQVSGTLVIMTCLRLSAAWHWQHRCKGEGS